MGRHLTDEQRAAVAADLRTRDGRSRAEIAREHGLSARSVSRIANDIGLADPFSTRDVRKATEAATDRMRARRAQLAERMLDEAAQLLDQLHVPHRVFSFGGKENTYNEHVLDRPPTGDIRNLMTSAAVALDKHVVLVKHDAPAADDGAGEVLGKLFEGLGAAYQVIKQRDGQADAEHGEQP